MKLQDLIERLTSWKSTATGIVGAILVLLVGFGVVGEEAKEPAVEGAMTFWDGVVLALLGFQSVLQIFTKEKTSNEEVPAK